MKGFWLVLTLVVASAGCLEMEDAAIERTATGEASLPEAFADVELRHDYTQAAETVSFEIPPGAGVLRIVARVEATALTCAGGVVAVEDPDGGSVVRRQGATLSVGDEECNGASEATRTFAPGTYNAIFSGQGVGVGVVRVTRA